MLAMQRASSEDRLAFLIHGPDDLLLGGDLGLKKVADPLSLTDASFLDQRLDGVPVRVITYPHVSPVGKVWLVVAETTHRRERQARHVLIETLASNLLLMSLTLWLVRSGVVGAMRPLTRLGSAVAARSPDDVSPLPVKLLPGELVPLVHAINRLMAHLKSAATQQQNFLSAAAHQLRTPLAGVQMQLELAAEGADDAQRQRLASVQGALRRMTHTTHQMLALARSGPQATQAAQFGRVDLRHLLEDAASDWLDAALAAQVDLGFDAQVAWVHGSPWMLRELLNNLISNALRHSAAGHRVTVSSGLDDAARSALLIVDDEGPGIPESLRSRVLERFYQAPDAARGGTGLGLSIVQEVTSRHGGTLSLQDGPGGRGLRVRVQIPVAPRDTLGSVDEG
jgi:two-component system sensor histidine kinase TctE